MIGQVVLAKNGDREAYAPIHTKLTRQSDPVSVAKALFGQTGCHCLYLADLDSFEGARPGWPIFTELADIGFSLWVDADWFRGESRLDAFGNESGKSVRPIVSTEQISDWKQFDRLEKLCKDGLDPIFSVDLRNGKVMSRNDALASESAKEILKRVVGAGVRTVIWLDVANVGTHCGVATNLESMHDIQTQFPEIAFVTGGGVRNPDDARELLSAGCKHVLVASAIHDCKFRPDDVTQLTEIRNLGESGVTGQRTDKGKLC